MARNQTTEQIISDITASPPGAAPEPEPEPAAEPEPEAPPEAPAKPEAGAEPAKPKQTMVPHGAFAEERGKRQEAEKELRETRQRMTRMEEIFAQSMRERQAPAPTRPEGQQPAAPPDWDSDPIAAGKHLTQMVQQLHQAMSGFGRERQESSGRERLVSAYRGAIGEFEAKQPDYMAAREYLIRDREAELREMGYADAAMRERIIAAEEEGIVGTAIEQGANPAERIYAVAKRRGYKPNGAQEQGPDKLATLQKGAQAARTLSGAKGTTEGAMTLEALANLDGAAFDSAWEKMRKTGALG